MNYFGQLFLKKSFIGYGCLVLLGSVSVAGISELELKHRVFSKWVEKISQNIQDKIQSSKSASTQNQITTQQVFAPFIIAGQAVSSAAETIWPYVTGTIDVLKSFKANIAGWFAGIKSFFKSLLEPEIFKLVFKNLHKKIWQLLIFMIVGADGARDQFVKLFGKDKKEKTLQAAQLLLGMTNEKNKNFRAKPEVFNFLLLKWLDNPKKVTGKFDRLSESIDKLFEKLKTQNENGESGPGGGNGGGGEVDEKKVYELDIRTTNEYLETAEGLPEQIYNLVWGAEVFSKITEGLDYTNRAKSWVSVAGSFWPF